MLDRNARKRGWSAGRTVVVAGVASLFMLAAAPRSAHAAGVFLGFQAETLSVATGATFSAELRTLRVGDAFNAFDAGVLYDGTALTFVPSAPVSKQRGLLMTNACAGTFHRFSAQPESLAITLVLLCNEAAVSSADVIYSVKFAAGNTPGWTRLRFGTNTQFFLGGDLVNRAGTREMVVRVGNAPLPVLGVGDRPGPSAGAIELAAPRPNPARTGDGVSVTLSLRQADDVTLELLDALGRRVAARPRERLAVGAHSVRWAVGGLAPGRYLLRARTARGPAVTRSWIVLQ